MVNTGRIIMKQLKNRELINKIIKKRKKKKN